MSGPGHYSFSGLTLGETVAHDGMGKIRTARVADRSCHNGLNFIDLTEIPPGHSIGIHHHGEQDEEVYVVISGIGMMSAGEYHFEVHPGDVVVNPVGGEHGLVNTGEETLRLVVFDVRI